MKNNMREKIEAAKAAVFAVEEEISNSESNLTQEERVEWRRRFYALRVDIGQVGHNLLQSIGQKD